MTIGLPTFLSTATRLKLYLPNLLTHYSNALPYWLHAQPAPAHSVAVGGTASGTTKPEQDIQRDKKRLSEGWKSQVFAATALFNVTEITCWLIDLIAAKRVPAPRLRHSWVGAVGAQATS